MIETGRGRLSFWDLLPDWADEARFWASSALAERKLTQLEILDGVNERLRTAAQAEGIAGDAVPQASRSSLNRLAMRKATSIRKAMQAKALFDGLGELFDPKASDQSSIVLGEFLKTLVLELVEEGGLNTKGAMELARAYQSIVQGMKISAERRQKLEAEYAAKAEKAITRVAKETGLSADTIAQLRRDFLGVRPNSQGENHAAGA